MLAVSAALAAVVVVGLGAGAVAAWFRAVGGGAAVGFAIAVFWHAQAVDKNISDVANRFGAGTLATIGALAILGGTANYVAKGQEKSHALDHAARADVLRFITGQGFWAGRPLIEDGALLKFGNALRHSTRPVIRSTQHRVVGVSRAVTRAASQSDEPLTVEGIVCSRYALVPNSLTRSLGFMYTYRLVSAGGRDEIHVVSGGSYATIARGVTVRVTGLIAAIGPRRDNDARNTALLMGLNSGLPVASTTSRTARQLCADA